MNNNAPKDKDKDKDESLIAIQVETPSAKLLRWRKNIISNWKWEDTISVGKTILPFVILLLCFYGAYRAWILWSRKWVYKTALIWRDKLAEDKTSGITMADLGQAGDIFGGINALFAAFAFIGVAFAAYYQRKTFIQQMKDSAANAYALKKSNETNDALLNNAKQELFNSLFFRMVEEMHSTINRIELTNESVYGDDRQRTRTTDEKLGFVEELLEQRSRDLRLMKTANPKILDDTQNIAIKLHNEIYIPNTRTLGPFFRNLYHTFLIIRDSKMTYSEQCQYSKIARASINERIVLLVMLNGLTRQGKNLKDLIERYGLLKHLVQDSVAWKLGHMLYKRTAFQGYLKREEVYDPESAKNRQK